MPDQLTREPILPKDVAQAYRDAKAGLNFGLRMQKDIRAWTQRGQGGDEKIVFNFFRSGNEGDGAKALEFQLPALGGEPYASLYRDLQRRQAALADSYPHAVKLDLKLDGKLVIGMGQASVYDNGITLHPVFGFPYLPGSSLKGVARRTYITEHFGDDEAAALANQQFCDLFGCTGDTEIEVERIGDKVRKRTVPSYYKTHPAFDKDMGDRRGRLIFFDGLPTSASQVAVDIVNPHYKPYYEKALPPADIYNPVPANFIVITGGDFSVVMTLDRPRDGREAEADQKGEALATARAALVLALTEDGIGGKTTVGYGRFDDVTEERRAAREKVENRFKPEDQSEALDEVEDLDWNSRKKLASARALVLESRGSRVVVKLLIVGWNDDRHELDASDKFAPNTVIKVRVKTNQMAKKSKIKLDPESLLR